MATVKSPNGASPQTPRLSMPAAGGRAVARPRPLMPLSALALGLLAASSITGRLVDGVYGESAATASMLRGLAAVLLWRRRPWGYVLAALALISGTVHQVGYLVALPFQAAADVPGAVGFDPLELPVAAAFLVGSAWLLAGLRRSPRVPSRSERSGHRAGGGIP
jgi:hypothetical protein